MIALIFILLTSLNVLAKPFILDVHTGENHSEGVAFFTGVDGVACTSYHTVEGASSIAARIDNQEYSVAIIGFDEVLDVAVLKVKGFNTKQFYTIGSDNINIGDIVTLNGYKNTFDGNVTNQSSHDFMIDIDISQGFSGSPIVKNGIVQGIVTSFRKDNRHALAVKSSKVSTHYTNMLNGKKFFKKDLDIHMMNVTKNTTLMIKMDTTHKRRGVLITRSENKKLQVWDIITHINSRPINNIDALQTILSHTYSDEILTIDFIRKNEKHTVEI
ncbi:MAG: S1-C subfamily serine protease [Candidatus Deianiraeaceae bacterium]|jgi:S1-C subfamily serine protease